MANFFSRDTRKHFFSPNNEEQIIILFLRIQWSNFAILIDNNEFLYFPFEQADWNKQWTQQRVTTVFCKYIMWFFGWAKIILERITPLLTNSLVQVDILLANNRQIFCSCIFKERIINVAELALYWCHNGNDVV